MFVLFNVRQRIGVTNSRVRISKKPKALGLLDEPVDLPQSRIASMQRSARSKCGPAVAE